MEIAKRMEVPMVVTNDVHYAKQEDAKAQDVLVCIGTKRLLSDTDRMKFENDQFYIKSEAEMASLFPDYPEMISNTKKIADMCNCKIPQFKTQELKDCLPVYQIPPEFKTQDDYVRHLVYTGLEKRYKEITDEISDFDLEENDLLNDSSFEIDNIVDEDKINPFVAAQTC